MQRKLLKAARKIVDQANKKAKIDLVIRFEHSHSDPCIHLREFEDGRPTLSVIGYPDETKVYAKLGIDPPDPIVHK